MKKLIQLAVALFLVAGMTACFETVDKVFDEKTLVEFQQAITSTPAVGRTYPLISSANSTTATTTLTSRLNLVGPQRSSDLTVKVFVDQAATTTAPNSFTLANDGNVVIPANSSVGTLTINIARASATTAPLRNLVVVLDSTSADFKPSENYKRLGFTIRQ